MIAQGVPICVWELIWHVIKVETDRKSIWMKCGVVLWAWSYVRETLMTKPQPKDTQGDKGWYENNVQLVQWISSVYKSANDRYIETCLVQWISSEIKLRKSHCTGHNPKPYTGACYIIRMNKGNGNIDENPDIIPLSMHCVSTCNFNSSSHRPALSTIWCISWTSSIVKGGSRFAPGYPPVHGRGWGIFPHTVEALVGVARNWLGAFSFLQHW